MLGPFQILDESLGVRLRDIYTKNIRRFQLLRQNSARLVSLKKPINRGLKIYPTIHGTAEILIKTLKLVKYGSIDCNKIPAFMHV